MCHSGKRLGRGTLAESRRNRSLRHAIETSRSNVSVGVEKAKWQNCMGIDERPKFEVKI